jgi:hypothetical protein
MYDDFDGGYDEYGDDDATACANGDFNSFEENQLALDNEGDDDGEDGEGDDEDDEMEPMTAAELREMQPEEAHDSVLCPDFTIEEVFGE